MAITWGVSKINNSTGGTIRIGYEITRPEVYVNTNSITWTAKIYVNTNYSVSDGSNTFLLSGSWTASGPKTISLPSGGGTQLIHTQNTTTSNLSPGDTASVTLFAQMSGVFANNVVFNVSGASSVKIPDTIAKIWKDSSYQDTSSKVWNGTSWVDADILVWDGSTWEYPS